MRQVTKEDIDTIRSPWVWDIGNRILYDMCRAHLEHSQDGEIVAKVWLIGRSYAASIERRRNAKHIGDDFYEAVVAPTMRNQPIDLWLGSIQQVDPVPQHHASGPEKKHRIPDRSRRTHPHHNRHTDMTNLVSMLRKPGLYGRYVL